MIDSSSVKRVYRKVILTFFLTVSPLLCSCQLGYIAESAYHQAKLMRKRVPLTYALKNYDLTDAERKKIELAIQLRQFMKEDLKLDTKSNYKRYAQLDQKYVTYAVNAAQKDKLIAYTWNFPVIGSVPYKGYFKEDSAIEEAKELSEKGLDAYVRGVAAYSTLGWFEDPLLSSMLHMKEHEYINTLIHETVHANLYIKGESKFNERVASFLGQLGTEAYYAKNNRQTELKQIVEAESHDELLFSEFISQSMEELRQWYETYNGKNVLVDREQQFKKMKQDFAKNFKPRLKTKNYDWFAERKFNNAFLLLLELYNSDFTVLEKLAQYHDRDFHKVFDELKKLEDADNPEEELKIRVSKLETKAANS